MLDDQVSRVLHLHIFDVRDYAEAGGLASYGSDYFNVMELTGNYVARVLKALDDLPTDQKEVIVLGVFQDLSYAQMEEITGTKAVTLRSRMFHGLKKLSKLIGGEVNVEPQMNTDERG